MKKKWLSAIVAAALSVCVLTAPISVSNSEPTVAVLAASSGTTLADMPSTYQFAAEWILQNRIISEGSVKDWATIYDQIVAGNGTLKYVVKWQSKQTITLEQRKQLQTVLETAVNDWTDWLVGYENWPYTHVKSSAGQCWIRTACWICSRTKPCIPPRFQQIPATSQTETWRFRSCLHWNQSATKHDTAIFTGQISHTSIQTATKIVTICTCRQRKA